MVNSEVIIVGGGPAGAACAWELKRRGVQAVILEREPFHATKPCAGWITPAVLRSLRIQPRDYPFGLLTMKRLVFSVRGVKLAFPTRQYSIRRSEFDTWLLDRTGVPVFTHRVHRVIRQGDSYLVDDAFTCRFIVGAGGTSCPVYASLFKGVRPRAEKALILTLEDEVPFRDEGCTSRLWFFDKSFPGYAWYVPKEGGYLNVGVGGKSFRMKQKHISIRFYWKSFMERLREHAVSLGEDCSPRGYAYYLRQDTGPVHVGNAYLVGDAAGLATVDMGEGIGPAVQSGIMAARAIALRRPYTLDALGRYSLWDILMPGVC
ncbi:MAG TPA: NAD(P)/FAD-dependent oxidoreductase [Deltaproteobacteria bacterium]|nr:NAD(P)/FAD-dependent oxidoreductase [Deltaproteobacteria bacterium]HOI07416.1 NAD(P)/FAD-dependent oxidoreductase [Deltaproteobacteria bacterium]